MAENTPRDIDLRRDLPGVVRVVASSGWRMLGWTVNSSVNATNRTLKAMLSGESPAAILETATVELRAVAALLRGGSSAAEAVVRADDDGHDGVQVASTPEALLARGAELLARSADVRSAAEIHPAYARILDELAPDEARILRLLAVDGPQPSVDVRTSRPMGIGSEMVASGLSMIGLQSGVRNVERTNAYLNNLFRLGLVWFSREQVEPAKYQVVEVQPEVADAMKHAGRAPKTVRRSIHLTPFGEDFCHTCLPLTNGSGPA